METQHTPAETKRQAAPDQKTTASLPQKRFTRLGTPCARSWDHDWIARVNQTERQLHRRVCGARTPAGNPCALEPNHKNGRCKFHGGFDLTGAPKGNRNAVIHGLYSRRLRACGPECPTWKKCPCANKHLADVPPADRPTCPYDQTAYNTALSDALAAAKRKPNPSPLDLHYAHNLAMLQVMLNRAATELNHADLVQTLNHSGDNPKNQTAKPSAQLTAYTMLAREYRRVAALLEPKNPTEPPVGDLLRHEARKTADISLDPDRADELHPPDSQRDDQAMRYMDKAIQLAELGHRTRANRAWDEACFLEPNINERYAKDFQEAYRPKRPPS